MAKDLALDPETRDLKWPLQYISGKDEIQQCLETLVMTPKGSFLDYPEVGMDYTFLFKKYNPFELKLAVHNALLEDERVTNINDIKIKRKSSHTVEVFVDVQTTMGRIKFDKEMNDHATR